MTNLISRVRQYFQKSEVPRTIPQGEPVCNLSPFNNEWNGLCLAYAQMQRDGATKEQLEAYVQANPITTTEGQWKLPRRYI